MSGICIGKIGKQLIIAFALSFVTLISIAAVGCGGSTSGTGGITVQGKLLDSNSAALPGITVSVAQSAATGVTGADGSFVLGADSANSIGLIFDLSTGAVQSLIENIPSDAIVIVATFRVNTEGNSVSSSDVTVERRDDGDPASGDDDDDDNDDNHGSSSGSSSSSGIHDDDDDDDDDDDSSSSSSSSSSDEHDDDDDSSSSSGGSDDSSSSSDDHGSDDSSSSSDDNSGHGGGGN